AIAEYRIVLDMDPNFIGAHREMNVAYKGRGMEEESISEWKEETTLVQAPSLAERIKIAYARGGYKSALKARLNYNQYRPSGGTYVSFSYFALKNASLGG